MTIEELWQTRKNITHVAKREGKPGIYLALAHNTPIQAFDAAYFKQPDLLPSDMLENDWIEAEAP